MNARDRRTGDRRGTSSSEQSTDRPRPDSLAACRRDRLRPAAGARAGAARGQPRRTFGLPLTLRQRRLTQHRLHVIDGGVAIAALDPTTRVLADGRTLEHLRGLGRAAATGWLEADA